MRIQSHNRHLVLAVLLAAVATFFVAGVGLAVDDRTSTVELARPKPWRATDALMFPGA